ncbi:Lrp/AsnC family transcriptional regulator [Candidatus Woesearchaeota archaeon]|nr:Lrp/AsnC family transcriptional regulator [Candidatus Woesearchaeota archaeon]
MGVYDYIGERTPVSYGRMETLDTKDQKILNQLVKNGRLSLSTIGKRVGLSREVINYRISKLAKKGILEGFTTFINTARLGIQKHVVLIQLQNLSKIKEKEIIEKLMAHNKLIWVGTCGGRWDLGLIFSTNSLKEFDQAHYEVKKILGDHLKESMILPQVWDRFTECGFIFKGKESNSNNFDMIAFEKDFKNQEKSFETIEIDRQSKEILKLLMKNCRTNLAEISDKTSVSIDTVKNKIKDMINKNIITHFRGMVSYELLGYQWNWLLLKFNYFDEHTERKLFEFCKQNPYTLWFVRHIGEWDVRISVYSENALHFQKILSEIRDAFQKELHSYDFVQIFSHYKYLNKLD